MTQVLIDTHIFIWALTEPKKLKDIHRSLLSNLEVDCLVSVSSLFEIAIKRSIGKLDFNLDFKEVMDKSQFTLLNISFEHLEQYVKLPLHHSDPYDRMIIAQSIVESIPLISYDKNFNRYDYLKL